MTQNKIALYGTSSNPITPLWVTANIVAKVCYVADSPLTCFPNRLEYHIPKEIAKSTELILGINRVSEATDLYIAIPLFSTEVKPTRFSCITAEHDLTITNNIFGSLYSVTSSIKPKDKYIPPVPYKLIMNGVETRTCTLCRYQGTKIGNFCVMFDKNYSCLFKVGVVDDPKIESQDLSVKLSVAGCDVFFDTQEEWDEYAETEFDNYVAYNPEEDELINMRDYEHL